MQDRSTVPAALPLFVRLRDLLLVLTQKELRVRYKSYTLGYFWSLLSPLVQAALFYFVFGLVMKSDIPNFQVHLIVSLFIWQWVSNSISTASMNFVGNAPLIKKVPFPHLLLVLVNNIQDLLHFLLCLPIIFGLLLWFHLTPSVNMILGIPLLILLQLLLTFSVSLIISTVNLFFRDLERIVALLLQFLFYGTPIVYSESAVPAQFQWVMQWNPFARLVIAWRSLLFDGAVPLQNILLLFVVTLPLFICALWFYKRLHWRFAEVL